MAELPTGTVTFLFTDLEGSTRLWQEHPEAMRVASARHDELVRAAIEAHDGYVVKSTGDGFHAAFGAAHDAIAAAIAAQLALAAEPWPTLDALRVRMGIHSGPAELRDGDYYGMAVNKAARLMSVAHAGQIVVSLATEELVPDGDIELIDLGEHALRDLARAERVFQVAHPGLDREFPRLTSSQGRAGNLPSQVTSFVGREDDVARIAALLYDSALVTLTGAGGVGKTRLAVQVAADVASGFAEGAWLCELAAVDDGEAMVQVVAAALGCVHRSGLSLAESIVEYVKVRELLIILDNCEHVLDDASDLAAAIVRSCASVRVVATSREALDVAGERVVRVRSLSAPASTARHDELLGSPAVRLFADRAREAGADIPWDERQWAAVGDICRRIDGIPLAIELAAARTTAMNPSDVAAHLDERFRLLTGRRRGQVERHQTLRATVEWSYQLLDDNERAVFDRLGVFAGTFDSRAAVAVVGDDAHDAWGITDALSKLVAKSMLVTESGPDGTTRFGMLETLRQFARERLDAAGDTDRLRWAFANHYALEAYDIGEAIMGPDDVLADARFRADLDNVRAAISWALERDDADERRVGLRTLASLEEVLRLDPALGLGTLAVQALSAAEKEPPDLRVPVMTLAAYHDWQEGRPETALQLIHDALRDGIVPTNVSPFAPYIGAVTFEMSVGNHDRSLAIAEEARAQIECVKSIYSQAHLLASIATFEALAGRFEQARVDAQRALELARSTGNVAMVAYAHMSVAWALQRDDPAAALAAAEEFINRYDEFHFAFGATSGNFALAGALRARLGDNTGALEFLQVAVTIARDQGVRPQLVATLDYAVSPLLRVGRPEVAATFLGALLHGPLAGLTEFPGVAAARVRSLDRAQSALGDACMAYLARGAAMSTDQLIDYAIRHLEPV